MDSFTFKDKSSTEFSNLVVVSLPPITKPTLRVEEIEIAGRDGSLITPQGYSTYKKKISLIQIGDLDIEELKAWLDGEGQLTLSNESDKYYNARVIKSIDYSRLELYDEITVEFLVQPYKYKLNEEDVSSTASTFTVTNYGTCESKPTIALYGSGTVSVAVNGVETFTYTFPTNESYVVIDSASEEAYFGNINNLRNRQMNGDFPKLNSGENTFTITGTITETVVTPNSRWL